MSNVATAIRDEIKRVARRAIKSETEVLRRSSAQYRRDIARLKRELAAAQRKIALLESITKKHRERVVETPEATNGKRFSPKWLQAHRARLGISAAEYGQLIGVSGQTVYLWEQGKSRPRAKAFARWVEVRGLGKRAALARLSN
jgi:DNA-binding transcriptional regulator YiaG